MTESENIFIDPRALDSNDIDLLEFVFRKLHRRMSKLNWCVPKNEYERKQALKIGTPFLEYVMINPEICHKDQGQFDNIKSLYSKLQKS